MGYLTTRNKALQEEWRLITAKEEDGTEWYAPDGHFATTYPIYDGYRVKKGQLVPEGHPNMTVILNELAKDEYLPAQATKGGTDNQGTEYWVIADDTGYVSERVAHRYYDLVRTLYPTGELSVNNNRPLRAVKCTVDGELVALLMPMKK